MPMPGDSISWFLVGGLLIGCGGDNSKCSRFNAHEGSVQTEDGERVVVIDEEVLGTLASVAVNVGGDVRAFREAGRRVSDTLPAASKSKLHTMTNEQVAHAVSSVMGTSGWGKLSFERAGSVLLCVVDNAPKMDEANLAMAAWLGGFFSHLFDLQVVFLPMDKHGTFIIVNADVAEQVWVWIAETSSALDIANKLESNASAPVTSSNKFVALLKTSLSLVPREGSASQSSGLNSLGRFHVGDQVSLTGGYNGVEDWLDSGEEVIGEVSSMYLAGDELPEFYRKLVQSPETLKVIEVSLAAPVSLRGKLAKSLTLMLNPTLNDNWMMTNTQHSDPVVVIMVKNQEGTLDVIESHATLKKQ